MDTFVGDVSRAVAMGASDAHARGYKKDTPSAKEGEVTVSVDEVVKEACGEFSLKVSVCFRYNTIRYSHMPAQHIYSRGSIIHVD